MHSWLIILGSGAFLLLWGAVEAHLTSDSYRVHGFATEHDLHDEIYSGYMPLVLEENLNHEGSFFFFLAMQRKAKRVKGQEKLLIWLNGGPGCSSMIGNIEENGPFRLSTSSSPPLDEGVNASASSAHPSISLESNPYSWSEAAHVLFVEQPIRVGFSPASDQAPDITSEQQVAHDMRSFLTSFLTVFQEFEDMQVYISGESYAGFYIPWVADHLVRTQAKGDYNRVVKVSSKGTKEEVIGQYKHINIQGVAIGNGALDFITMNPSYAEYMYSRGFITHSAKEYFDDKWAECLDRLLYQAGTSPITTGALSDCMMLEDVLAASGNPNVYNTGTFNLPDDAKTVQFFNDPHIQELLHVRGKDVPGINFHPELKNANIVRGEFIPPKWEMCNFNITESMSHDHPISSVPAIANIMQHIRVLLYNGAMDLSCNHLGATHALEMTNWNGLQWKDANRSLMKHGNDVFGQHYELQSLSFLVIRHAGHFVPTDQPSGALDMIERFLLGKSFADVPLPSDRSYANLPIEPAALDILYSDVPRGDSNGYYVSHEVLGVVGWGVSVSIVIYILLHQYRENQTGKFRYSDLPS